MCVLTSRCKIRWKKFIKEMILAGFKPSQVASRASYCRGLNQPTHNYFCFMGAHFNYNNICIIFSIYIQKNQKSMGVQASASGLLGPPLVLRVSCQVRHTCLLVQFFVHLSVYLYTSKIKNYKLSTNVKLKVILCIMPYLYIVYEKL